MFDGYKQLYSVKKLASDDFPEATSLTVWSREEGREVPIMEAQEGLKQMGLKVGLHLQHLMILLLILLPLLPLLLLLPSLSPPPRCEGRAAPGAEADGPRLHLLPLRLRRAWWQAVGHNHTNTICVLDCRAQIRFAMEL